MTFLEQTSAVEIMDTRIAISESGKGEPVVFLHGNPGSRHDFIEIARKLSDTEIHCILPNRPGHMSSDEMLLDQPDPWADADLFAEFIDEKCDGSSWLVGYSMGAYIACKVAIKYPDKVKGIVMLAPYLVPDNPNEKPSSIPELAKGAFIGTVLGAFLPQLSQSKLEKHINTVFLPQKPLEGFMAHWLPKFTRFETLMAVMTDKNAMLASLSDVHEKMAKIKVPVSALVGMKDQVCSAEKQIDLIEQRLKDASITEVAEGSHALPFSNVEECADFIKKCVFNNLK